MITKSTKFLLLFIIFCISSALSAQSIYWGDGKEFIRKTGTDTYEPVPAGIISYKITDGKCFRYMEGELDIDAPVFRYEKAGNKVNFYKGDEMIGYLVPAEGRYYDIYKSKGESKEEVATVLIKNKVYDGNGKVRFTVDSGFSQETLGLLLLANF